MSILDKYMSNGNNMKHDRAMPAGIIILIFNAHHLRANRVRKYAIDVANVTKKIAKI